MLFATEDFILAGRAMDDALKLIAPAKVKSDGVTSVIELAQVILDTYYKKNIQHEGD